MKKREVAPERRIALWWLRQSEDVVRRFGREPAPTSIENVRRAETIVKDVGEHLTRLLSEPRR